MSYDPDSHSDPMSQIDDANTNWADQVQAAHYSSADLGYQAADSSAADPGDPSQFLPAPHPPPVPHYVLEITEVLKRMNETNMAFQTAMTQFISRQTPHSVPSSAPINPASAPINSASAPRSAPRVRDPRRFNGKIEEVEPFLNEIEDCLFLQRHSFATDEDKSRYTGLYMGDGSPVEWFAGVKRSNPALLQNFVQFIVEFRSKFSDPHLQSTALRKLDHLRQTSSAFNYLTKFKEIVTYLQMTEETKCDRFLRGLKEEIKDALIPIHPRPTTLASWEPIILGIDNNLYMREIERRHGANAHLHLNPPPSNPASTASAQSSVPSYIPPPSSVPIPVTIPAANPPVIPSTPDPVPMEIDAIRTHFGPLTPDERTRRIQNNLCLYCGQPGHVRDNCNKRIARHGTSA